MNFFESINKHILLVIIKKINNEIELELVMEQPWIFKLISSNLFSMLIKREVTATREKNYMIELKWARWNIKHAMLHWLLNEIINNNYKSVIFETSKARWDET